MFERKSKILFFWAVAATIFCFQNNALAVENTEELLKVVVLSRHGARAPLQNREYLEQWTEKAWPYWTVSEGCLTQRGSLLVSALWEQMYDLLGLEAFFPKNACPNGELVYIRANNVNRTSVTATAILNGLFPGCDIPYRVTAGKGFDPLFLPYASKKFMLNKKEVLRELGEYYGGFEGIRKELEEPLQVLADILGPCPEATCRKYNLSPGCTILDIPGEDIKVVHKFGVTDFTGSLGAAELLVENFWLSSIQWPNGTIGDMDISVETLKKIAPIRPKIYSMAKGLPSLARRNGSGILEAIATALTDTDANDRVNKAKLVIFVGHDLNILTTANLLSLHWDIEGYAHNDPVLGGFIAFSLWKTPKGEVVRAHYACQSLEALTSDDISSQGIMYTPLALSPFARPCSKPSEKKVFECEKAQFLCWVQSVIDKKHIQSRSAPLKEKRVSK